MWLGMVMVNKWQDLRWEIQALKNGPGIWVTDGSSDEKLAPSASGTGWVFNM